MIKYFLFSAIFLAGNALAQTAVSWGNLKNASVSGTTLSKSGGVKGQASSTNLLPGSYAGNLFNGSFSFTNTGSLNQLKTIGYSVSESPESGFELIEYGFSFSNNTVKAYGKDSHHESALSSGQTFKIERTGDLMKFYIDGAAVYQEQIDVYEYLIVRAHLKSNSSAFSGVTVSFDGLRPVIDPQINTASKTIALNTGSAFPGINWQDGEKGPDTKKFIPGTYAVDLYDASNRKLKRSFAAGEDASWENLSGLTVSGTTISKTSGGGWGTATSQAVFGNTEKFWTETAFLPQTESKAFGFVLSSANLQNTSALEAGFIVSANFQLQVIHRGSVIKTIEVLDKDRLNVSYRAGNIRWLVNGTTVYETESSFSGNVKVAALLKNGTAFTQVQHAKENQYHTGVWDNALEKGTIAVDITDIPGITGPFHYYLSSEPIPPFREIYAYERDSLNGGVLDSAAFYLGTVSSTQNTFYELGMGLYYLAVFNSLGERVYAAKDILAPALSLINNTGYTLSSGGALKATQTNAHTELTFYMNELRKDAAIEFEVKENVKKQHFGLMSASETNAILHGFQIENRRIKTIVNGNLETGPGEVIAKNAILRFIKSADKLYLIVNGVIKENVTLGSGYILKAGVATEVLGVETKANNVNSNKGQVTYSEEITYANCDNSATVYSFTINNSGPAASFTYTLTNTATSAVLSGSGTTGTPVSFSDLAVGIYDLEVTIGSTMLNETVYIGVESKWDPVTDYALTPNTYSLLKTQGTLASALSENIIKSTDNGWVQFTPVVINAQPNINYLTFSTDNTTGTPLSGETYMSFKKGTGNFLQVKFHDPNTDIQVNIGINSRFTILFLPTQIQIKVGATLYATLDRPSGAIHLKANSLRTNEGFLDVVCSFSCREEISYAMLKYELDGYYHIMKDGKIYFEYENEYKATDLRFTIYKSLNVPIRTEEDFPAVPVRFGRNYITLDVQTDEFCIGKGFFYLETVNEKNEKKYLRFYNDYDNCTVPIGPQ